MTTLPAVQEMKEVRVPMFMVEGRPAVEVTVGAHGPYLFVLDTGASATVLNADLVAELSLASQGDVLLSDPTGGSGTPGRVHHLESIGVGGWSFRDVFAVSWGDAAVSSRLEGTRGVLGVPSLAGVALEFDFPDLELGISTKRLRDGDGSEEFADQQSVIPTLPLRLGSDLIEAHIDTGNGRGIGLPRSIEGRLDFIGPLAEGTARSASGDFTIHTGRLDGTVQLSGLLVEQPAVFVNDRFPMANVGTPALMHARMTVDVGRRRIRLEEK